MTKYCLLSFVAFCYSIISNKVDGGQVNFTWWAGRKNQVAVSNPSRKWLWEPSNTPGTRYHASVFFDDLKNIFYLMGGDTFYGDDFNVANDVWICDLSRPYNNQWVTSFFK
jgi:hypothetical protein